MKKIIQHILTGREKQITPTEIVRQPLPHKDFRFANPFIVLHHIGPHEYAPGSKDRIQPHPHRGFAPYTFMLKGEGYHRDNAGYEETIQEGGIQWMFAGKGIMHSEGPTPALLERGGVQEAIQLWINVPRANKWDDPFYQSASRDQLPEVLKSDGVSFRLASGDYDGCTGPIRHFTPVITMIGEMQAGRSLSFHCEPGYWTLIYVVHGNVEMNGSAVTEGQLVVFEKKHDEVFVQANSDAQLLFLSADPLDEPVAARDNFVMNTQEEIEQAIYDARNGGFGSLSY